MSVMTVCLPTCRLGSLILSSLAVCACVLLSSVDKVLHLAGSPNASHYSKVIANALCIIEDAFGRYG